MYSELNHLVTGSWYRYDTIPSMWSSISSNPDRYIGVQLQRTLPEGLEYMDASGEECQILEKYFLSILYTNR